MSAQICSHSWSILLLALQSWFWNPDPNDRVIFINQLKLNAMTSSLVMQILAGAQYIKINLPKMSISQNLNLQPLVKNLSQVNNYLYIESYQINKNMSG